jgi:hypothetical protein
MKSYQGWNINSPESKNGNWSVILEHKHSTRTHFINLKNSLTLLEVEALIYDTIDGLVEEESKR